MPKRNGSGSPKPSDKPKVVPEFMKIPTNKQFVFHKISSRCSLLFDSCVATLEACDDEGVNTMMHAYEGSYEGIVNMESNLIERYLNHPIRCRDTECNTKMEYIPTYGMRVWNLDGHIVATPENYIVIEQKAYHRQMAPSTMNVALDTILMQKKPFKSLSDFNKINSEVQKLVQDQMQHTKSTLFNIIQEIKKHGLNQNVLSFQVINNLESFAKTYIEMVEVSTMLLEKNEQIIADKQKRLIPEKTLQTVPNGDLNNVGRDYMTKETRCLQTSIKSIFPQEVLTLSPIFFEDGSIKARTSVHNAAVPHNYHNIHEKPGGDNLKTWKFEPKQDCLESIQENKKENPNAPPQDPSEPFPKSEVTDCENHPPALPPSVLVRYKQFLQAVLNPYAAQNGLVECLADIDINSHVQNITSLNNQGIMSDEEKDEIIEEVRVAKNRLLEALAKLSSATTRFRNGQNGVHGQPGTSTDVPNWHGEGTSTQNQPSTSTAPPVVKEKPVAQASKKNNRQEKPRNTEPIKKTMQPKATLPQNREK